MRKIIAATLLALGLTTMVNAQQFTLMPTIEGHEPGSNYESLTSKTYKVEGKPDIESFFIALAPGIDKGFEDIKQLKQDIKDETYFTIDKKNGFIKYSCEGAGGVHIESCYWNTKNKQKMVAVYYDAHDEFFKQKENSTETESEIKTTSYLAFFLYNEETKTLESIEPPFRETLEMPKIEEKAGEEVDKGLQNPIHFICRLPQHGKNIEYRFGREEDENQVWHTLTFNGLLFEETK